MVLERLVISRSRRALLRD
jgi:hypothetical protein